MLCNCNLESRPEIWLCSHHRYFKGETEYNSVSSVIRAVSDDHYRYVKPIVLETARMRGHFVDSYFSGWLAHPNQAPKLRDFHQHIEPQFPIEGARHADDVIKRITALENWWVEGDYSLSYAQKIVYSDKDGIAGTLDIATDEWILDLKCVAKLQDTYRMQLGAYSDYFDNGRKVGILWVPKDKKPDIVPYDAKECREEWRRAVEEFYDRD